MKLRWFSIIILLAAITAPAYAGVIYVKGDSAGPVFDGTSWDTAYHTVQAGVDAAVSGDEVWVAAGNYAESVTLKAGVKLLGGYAGSGTMRDIKEYVSKITSCVINGDSTLEGFSVEGSTERGVDCKHFGFTVRSNTITGTQTYGIYAYLSGTIEYNTISNYNASSLGNCYGLYTGGAKINANRISGPDIGISSGGGVISNNIVRQCYTGVESRGASLVVSYNLLIDNAGYGLTLPAYLDPGVVRCNIIARNAIGIQAIDGGAMSYNDVFGNRLDYATKSGELKHSTDMALDPAFESPESGDYRLTPSSPCVNRGYPAIVSPDPKTDIAGQPRFYGSKTDIGPYEFQPEERISVSPSNSIVKVMEPGAVAGVSQTYTLTNIGTQSVSWTASKIYDWVDLSATSGEIGAGQSVPVTVSINANASALTPGRYLDAVTFMDTTHSLTSSRNVRLTVGSAVLVSKSASGGVHDGTTWEKAYNTISEALDAALPGQEIRVAGGTYPEYITIRKEVTLKGGYSGEGDTRDIAANETIIEKPEDYGDTIQVESACAIDGFTITKGYDGVFGYYDSPVTITNCTFRGNTNTAVTIRDGYMQGTIRGCTITGNRNGLALYDGLASAVNNLIYNNRGFGIDITNGAAAVNNTVVGNGSGITFTTPAVVRDNLQYLGDAAHPLDSVFVNAAAGDFHLLPGCQFIDAGTLGVGQDVDKGGRPRPVDGDGDGVAKVDLGCYEFGVSNAFAIARAKEQPDASPVGIMCPVVTAALDGRFYVENPNRVGGIGVIGAAPELGKRVAIEGTMDTVDGERVIRPTSVMPGVTASVPDPWFVNEKALGGGPMKLQSGVSQWQYVKKIDDEGKPYIVRELSASGGASNIGLLVKMAGRVSGTGAGFFYLDGGAGIDDGDPAVKGVRVDWPFGAFAITNGTTVSVLGISSCRVVHDDSGNDMVVRMLRPLSAESVVTVQ